MTCQDTQDSNKSVTKDVFKRVTFEPDTTGYALGIYGMLSPQLGPYVSVTPDFTQAILQGEADVSGHITAFVLTVNALKLFFDKKLHLFLKKLKRNDKSSKHVK